MTILKTEFDDPASYKLVTIVITTDEGDILHRVRGSDGKSHIVPAHKEYYYEAERDQSNRYFVHKVEAIKYRDPSTKILVSTPHVRTPYANPEGGYSLEEVLDVLQVFEINQFQGEKFAKQPRDFYLDKRHYSALRKLKQ